MQDIGDSVVLSPTLASIIYPNVFGWIPNMLPVYIHDVSNTSRMFPNVGFLL